MKKYLLLVGTALLFGVLFPFQNLSAQTTETKAVPQEQLKIPAGTQVSVSFSLPEKVAVPLRVRGKVECAVYLDDVLVIKKGAIAEAWIYGFSFDENGKLSAVTMEMDIVAATDGRPVYLKKERFDVPFSLTSLDIPFSLLAEIRFSTTVRGYCLADVVP